MLIVKMTANPTPWGSLIPMLVKPSCDLWSKWRTLITESNIFCLIIIMLLTKTPCFIFDRIGTSYVQPWEDVKLESHRDNALRGREFPKKAFGPPQEVLHECPFLLNSSSTPTSLSLSAKHGILPGRIPASTGSEGYNPKATIRRLRPKGYNASTTLSEDGEEVDQAWLSDAGRLQARRWRRRHLSLTDISTHADGLAMLTLHIRSHDI